MSDLLRQSLPGIVVGIVLFSLTEGYRYYQRRPKTLEQRRKARRKLMKDICIVEHPSSFRQDPYGAQIETNCDSWETPCHVVPTGPPEIKPGTLSMGMYTVTTWKIEVPIGTDIKSGDRILYNNVKIAVDGLLTSYTDYEAVTIFGRTRP